MSNSIKNLLLIILAVANLITGSWIIYDKYFNNSFLNDYPLIDVSRNFIPQEHFIVNLQPLREELRAVTQREKDYTIAVYLEFLNTGANIAVNTDQNIWPASLVKVPLAMAVMKKVESGGWSLDNELVLFKQDKDKGSGTLFNDPVGSRFTIERLLQELLGNSDNTAHRILLRNMKASELQPIMDELGLETLFEPDGKVSAKEYSRIFRSLYTSSFLQRENSQKLLQWLTDSSFKEFLSAGLPEEIAFAHKWGKNENFKVWADSGLVYIPQRPYLITVMIQEKTGAAANGENGEDGEDEVKALMREMSQKTYDYFKNY